MMNSFSRSTRSMMPTRPFNGFLMRMGFRMRANRSSLSKTTPRKKEHTTMYWKFLSTPLRMKSKGPIGNLPLNIIPKITMEAKRHKENSSKWMKPTMHFQANTKDRTMMKSCLGKWCLPEPIMSSKISWEVDSSSSPHKKNSSNPFWRRNGVETLIAWWRMKIAGEMLTMEKPWKHQQCSQTTTEFSQRKQFQRSEKSRTESPTLSQPNSTNSQMEPKKSERSKMTDMAQCHQRSII